MNALVELRHDGPRTTSLMVADKFGKQHQHVMRSIQSLVERDSDLGSNFGLMIRQVETAKGASRSSRYYEIDQDGFIFLIMGFTGAEAHAWKKKFLAEFKRLEAIAAQHDNDDETGLVLADDSPVFAQIRGEDFDRKLSLAREIRLAYGRGAVRKMWNSIGLPPVEPDEDSEDFGDISDDIAAWLNERTARAPGHRVSMQALYNDYREYMAGRGADARGPGSLGKALVRAGFPSRKSNGAFRVGLRLI
ncbi:MAG: hypothetical protein E2598_07470 [Sphingobium sp.]|nr:hypothetical protein [Sphingobium sp.]